MQATAQSDSVLNYQLRILKADLIAYKHPKDALQLVEADPPSNLATGEFAVRRKLVQAQACSYLQDFPKAHNALNEGQTLGAAIPEMLPYVAFTRGLLADFQKDENLAEKSYRDAAQLAVTYHQPWAGASAAINLSVIDMAAERYGNAIDELSHALQGVADSKSIPEELILGKLGWSYYQIGDFDQSISSLQKARTYAERTGRMRDQQLWNTDLGDVYLDREDYENAHNSFSTALTLAQKLNDPGTIAGAFHNLAMFELKRADLKSAETYSGRAIEAAKKASDPELDAWCMLTAAEIAMKQKQFPAAEERLRFVTKAARDSSLRWRAQSDLANVYVAEKKTSQADKEFHDAIDTVESARSNVSQEERRMSVLDAWPFYDDYIHFLVSQNRPAKAIEIAEFSRARTLAEGLKIADAGRPAKGQLRQAQLLLQQKHQIALAYWIADNESYLWLVTPSAIRLFHLPPRQEIEREVDAYSAHTLDDRDADDWTGGQKLYAALVGPAAKLIPPKARVVIIPHRSLYKLNFETLVVPGDKPHYWLQDVVIETAGSVALLAQRSSHTDHTTRDLLLVGDPLAADSKYPQLRFAKEEIDNIRRHFPAQIKILADKDATAQNYLSASPADYKFIHFVAHGTANDISPLDSSIILSPQSDGSFRLVARDIVNRSVHADIVTISACSSAGTKAYSGEGLVGLAWAFMRAGAHQVVAALWEVNDRSTPELMDRFYTHMRENKQDAAEALREAKLEMIEKRSGYQFPYYWASLQLYTGS